MGTKEDNDDIKEARFRRALVVIKKIYEEYIILYLW